jgi:hypothetical protein
MLIYCHSAGKDVISRLLDKEENTRLGSKTGASEVKQHKWFSKINWGLLRNTEPPVSCATWISRLTTVAHRLVSCMWPGLWPCLRHLVFFLDPIFIRNLFCVIADRALTSAFSDVRSSLHLQMEWTLLTFAEWRNPRRSILKTNKTQPTLRRTRQLLQMVWSLLRAATCLVPFQVLHYTTMVMARLKESCVCSASAACSTGFRRLS